MTEGGDGGLEARVGRHENDRRPRIEQARALQHREAPDTGHDDVGEDDVELFFRDPRDRLLAAARAATLYPSDDQGRGQHLLHGNHVVDHENRRWHGGVTRAFSHANREHHSVLRIPRSRPSGSRRTILTSENRVTITRFATLGKSFTPSSIATPLRPCRRRSSTLRIMRNASFPRPGLAAGKAPCQSSGVSSPGTVAGRTRTRSNTRAAPCPEASRGAWTRPSRGRRARRPCPRDAPSSATRRAQRRARPPIEAARPGARGSGPRRGCPGCHPRRGARGRPGSATSKVSRSFSSSPLPTRISKPSTRTVR